VGEGGWGLSLNEVELLGVKKCVQEVEVVEDDYVVLITTLRGS